MFRESPEYRAFMAYRKRLSLTSYWPNAQAASYDLRVPSVNKPIVYYTYNSTDNGVNRARHENIIKYVIKQMKFKKVGLCDAL